MLPIRIGCSVRPLHVLWFSTEAGGEAHAIPIARSHTRVRIASALTVGGHAVVMASLKLKANYVFKHSRPIYSHNEPAPLRVRSEI